MPKLTPEQIKKQISEISEYLKGPMSDLERALLVADRKDLRKLLAELMEDSNA